MPVGGGAGLAACLVAPHRPRPRNKHNGASRALLINRSSIFTFSAFRTFNLDFASKRNHQCSLWEIEIVRSHCGFRTCTRIDLWNLESESFPAIQLLQLRVDSKSTPSQEETFGKVLGRVPA